MQKMICSPDTDARCPPINRNTILKSATTSIISIKLKDNLKIITASYFDFFHKAIFRLWPIKAVKYADSSESIQPFWICREPVARPCCNLASQRRLYYASVDSHSPVGLVSRQWDAVHWACVLCDRRIHNDPASRSANLHQCACPFYSSRAGFSDKASHHPGLSAPIQPRYDSLRLLVYPKAKIAVKKEEICECDGHIVHKLSQRRLTADWLAPRESDCSRMRSKVFSDRLPSYIKVTRPVLEIFKMAGYFPGCHQSQKIRDLVYMVTIIY
jgi:hypothetical protein